MRNHSVTLKVHLLKNVVVVVKAAEVTYLLIDGKSLFPVSYI